MSVEPKIPGKNKDFLVWAVGTADHRGNRFDNVTRGITLQRGLASCASTYSLSSTTSLKYWWDSFIGGNSPEDEPFNESALFGGQPAGHYHLCGYLSEQGGSGPPMVTARLEFTIGGTCASATKRVKTLKRGLASAQAKFASAKKSHVRRKISKTRQKVKKARNKLKTASADHKALCKTKR